MISHGLLVDMWMVILHGSTPKSGVTDVPKSWSDVHSAPCGVSVTSQ